MYVIARMEPQHCGNIREIRVVPNYNDNAIAGFAERSRDRPARDSLLHSLEDVTQQVRSLYACDVCRSAQQIGVCRMEAHHLPQVGFVDSAPTDFLLGHSVARLDSRVESQRKGQRLNDQCGSTPHPSNASTVKFPA